MYVLNEYASDIIIQISSGTIINIFVSAIGNLSACVMIALLWLDLKNWFEFVINVNGSQVEEGCNPTTLVINTCKKKMNTKKKKQHKKTKQ